MKLELRLDPGTKLLGRAILGGAPLRVLRLSEAGARLVREWRDGALVAESPQHRKLADRLIDAGMAHPVYGEAHLTRADVTVVVPARDPETLPEADVVVDDGSRVPISGAAQRHPVARGPAAARNTGLAHVTTELTAFLDADTTAPPDWLDPLLPHFEDPAVVAVAPRIRSTPGSSVLARYETARSSLDLGDGPAPVRQGGRVTYVPTAALVVRTAALRELGGFDERLRFGEDVDLVWRLVARGGRVRYEPAAEVLHVPRKTWRAWARQRFDYGTSAAPLARRHGHQAIAPLRISGWTALAWGLVAARRPALGVAVALGTAALLPRKLRPLGVPARESLTIALRGHLRAGRYLADVLTRTWGPVAVPLLLATRRGRALLALALARHLAEWREARPDLDPARWLLARTADDLCYGAGVWRSCLRERNFLPLVPDFSNWPGKK
ncbi:MULTISPECIES: mycofactocin biosynthesis glycosyltransferase MftF [Amycolatopsis]|uniref:Mycofactocin system glycosyltransferase n=2 Tax=Amycolatopsis TaxID=1813 RepID=A0A1I4DES5_9PSEU|nr:mycofactocin biosynthesis glycosyltransferase MftF [Amycolatopsis sacchari]SFK91429.1 mycofactocin system glycosyltransferase [Amycolatopsis sacchari]